MDDELKESPGNPIMLALAEALRKGKEGLNYPGKLPSSIPLLGGMGAGDLIMGQSPEAMKDWAYPGGGPIQGGPTLQTFKTDPRVVDAATLPFVGSGLAKVGKVGTTSMLANALREGTDMSRREFAKQAGAIAAGAAVPDIAKPLLKELAGPAAATAARTSSLGALKGLVAWAHPKSGSMTKWLDEINAGTNTGLDENIVKDTVRKIMDDSSIHSSLTKLGATQEDLIPRLFTDTPLKGQLEKYNPGELAKTEAAGKRFLKEHASNPELMNQLESWFATGVKPKGAPDYLEWVAPNYFAQGSEIAKLWGKVWKHLPEL